MSVLLKPQSNFAPRADPAPAGRILQVVLSLTPGGTERLVIDICQRIRHRFETVVCCLDDEGEWAAGLRDSGIHVVALHRRPGFRPEIGREIAQLARTFGAGVLHCHQYSPFVYGRVAQCWDPRLKIVYTEHGRLSDAPPSWKRRLVNPLLARFKGPIVAVSDELRQYLVTARFPRDRVSVIHNGIDAAAPPRLAERVRARAALGFSDDVAVVMSVGRLDPVKNFPSLLDAFALMRHSRPNARLVIVGDGPERAVLERRAAREDLAGAVEFLGMRSNVRMLLAGADLYVNSSISEGVSITILEAMAAGIPVVATAVGGTPEILADGIAGILVPARHPQRLAEAMTALCDNRLARARLATVGRRRLESSFTIQRMVAEYEQIYQRLLS